MMETTKTIFPGDADVTGWSSGAEILETVDLSLTGRLIRGKYSGPDCRACIHSEQKESVRKCHYKNHKITYCSSALEDFSKNNLCHEVARDCPDYIPWWNWMHIHCEQLLRGKRWVWFNVVLDHRFTSHPHICPVCGETVYKNRKLIGIRYQQGKKYQWVHTGHWDAYDKLENYVFSIQR